MFSNRTNAFACFALIGTLFLPPVGLAQSAHGTDDLESLDINVSSGKAPLTVTITGPSNFTNKVKAWDGNFGHGNAGWFINWGDETRDPVMTPGVKGKPVLSHVYSVAGRYQIRGMIRHLGPTDSAITDWVGEASVDVSGSGTDATTTPTVKILEPHGGEVFSYDQFPKVKWTVITDRQVELSAQLINQNGEVAGENTLKRISYNKPSEEATFRPDGILGYRKALLAKLNQFKLRIMLKDGLSGRILTEVETPAFTMADEYKPTPPNLKQIASDAPLSVVLDYTVNHPRRFSYILDWGDGTAPQEEQKSGEALLEHQHHQFKHNYARAGQYRVTLKSNNLDTFDALSAIPYYELVTVTAK